MNKEKYEAPEIMITYISENDIITKSGEKDELPMMEP